MIRGRHFGLHCLAISQNLNSASLYTLQNKQRNLYSTYIVYNTHCTSVKSTVHTVQVSRVQYTLYKCQEYSTHCTSIKSTVHTV